MNLPSHLASAAVSLSRMGRKPEAIAAWFEAQGHPVDAVALEAYLAEQAPRIRGTVGEHSAGAEPRPTIGQQLADLVPLDRVQGRVAGRRDPARRVNHV